MYNASVLSTIQALIDNDLLYIDYKKPYVCLSYQLHVSYVDDQVKLNSFRYRVLRRVGLIEPDARYIAFLDNILLYINFLRGLHRLPLFDYEEPLNFMVMSIDKKNPILVGLYENKEIAFSSYGKTSDY